MVNMDIDHLPHAGHDGLLQQPDNPQNSFVLSSSTASYYRGYGPTIHLSVDQIMQNSNANASSSATFDEVTSQPCSSTLEALTANFPDLGGANLSLSISMQSIVTSSALQELNLKRAWDIAFASAEDPRKALVPVQPVLHDIILHVWAYNVDLFSQCEDPSKMNNMHLDQSFWSLDVEQNQTEATDVSEHMHVSDSTSEPTAKKSLLSAFDVVGSSHSRFVDLPPRPPKKVVSLPTSIPSMDNLTPIVMSTVRRNPRLNKSDGYQHCQYVPRKRSRKSTTAATSEQAKPIEAMPELHGQDLQV